MRGHPPTVLTADTHLQLHDLCLPRVSVFQVGHGTAFKHKLDPEPLKLPNSQLLCVLQRDQLRLPQRFVF